MLDPAGNIYVTDSDNGRIQIFNSSGTFLSQFGSNGSGDGQFNVPYGITLDPAGNIYVADTGNDRIQIFDSSGTFLSKFGSECFLLNPGNCVDPDGAGPLELGDGQFNVPRGITLDTAGNIYVAGTNNHRIQIFDSSGTFLTKFGSGGNDPGQFETPTGVALDSSENIYVIEGNNNRIQKFTPFEINSFTTILPPLITPPPLGKIFTSSVVTIAGTSSANDTIEVFEGATSLGTTTTAANGTWIFTTGALTDGAHFFTATASDETNTSVLSNSITVTVANSFLNSHEFILEFGPVNIGNDIIRELNNPKSLAISPDDSIYVTTSNIVQKFGVLGGMFFGSFGNLGTDPGEFSGLYSIAIGPSGNIYTTEVSFVNPRVQIFNEFTAPVLQITPLFPSFAQFTEPFAIAVNSVGNIYVTDDRGIFQTHIFDSSGTSLSTFGSGNSFGATSDMIFDHADNLYTTEFFGAVRIFDSSGTLLSTLGSSCSMSSGSGCVDPDDEGPLELGDGQFFSPRGITLDSAGNIYVADNGNDRIQILDSDGNFLSKFGTTGTGDGQFDDPYDVALDSVGNIYVLDNGNIRVQKFTPFLAVPSIAAPVITSPTNGAMIDSNAITVLGTFTTTGTITIDIILDGTDNIGSITANDNTFGLVAGGGLLTNGVHTIVARTTDSFGTTADSAPITITINAVLGTSPTFLSTFGTEGTADGQFNSPRGIAFDSSGNIYVSESNNDRIQKFDSTGNFLSKFGTEGSADGQFDSPKGIALDTTGNIYVADDNNERIQIFDSSGTLLTQFGTEGTADGQFDDPVDVALDTTGNIYVLDSGNSSVQIFDSSGAFLLTFGSSCRLSDSIGCVDPDGTGPLQLGDGQFRSPDSIALDSVGNIYVSDAGNDRVQKFTSFNAVVVITPPVITSPTDGATITTSTVTITGTSVADATIEVFDGATSLDNVTANSNGDWTFTTGTLADGAHSFTATANDGTNTSAASGAVNITVDTTTPSSFTAWTQNVIDLRNSKPQAFQDTFPISTTSEINRLLAWAGNPTAQTNNSELSQYAHMYSPMKSWNERTDLQGGFPEVSLAEDMNRFITWSGRENVLANPGNSDLAIHEPTYVLLRIYFLERNDLRDNDVFNGADDSSAPNRLYCWGMGQTADVRLAPHAQFYTDNCVL